MMTIQNNSVAYENEILMDPLGFREYDARWEFGKTINLLGIQQLGFGLGTQLCRRYPGVQPKIVTGHDYRSYSQSVKFALIIGLMQAGCRVVDIGLALSPTAYFAQEQAGAEGVAMVTASHNPNGWTGVKMGVEPKLTHGPQEMRELKDIVLTQDFDLNGGGSYEYRPELAQAYINHHVQSVHFNKKLKLVVGCGNGTAAAFAPEVFKRLGCEVIERHCTPDFTFPHFNPNPENSAFMADLAKAVRDNGADLGVAFDGDGDRIGFVTDEGEHLTGDISGLILTRFLAQKQPGSTFVVDVKSTGLYQVDEILKETGCKVDYWKTGHSYIKRRVKELNACAGFEKSGHFFINEPHGPLYDDALAAALTMLQTLEEAGEKLSNLVKALPQTHQTPTYHPECADDAKYTAVDAVVQAYQTAQQSGEKIGGQAIENLLTVNGVRVVLADGTWGLVRASSNVPALVVLAESPTSAAMKEAMVSDLQARLNTLGTVGPLQEGH
jgi:phosphomannomutase/phosphoglucomutase